MEGREEIDEKLRFIKRELRGTDITWQSAEMSVLEGILSRGDGRLSRVIRRAWEGGAKFDAWNDFFSWERWLRAFDGEGIDPAEYLRERRTEEELPWDFIDTGIRKEFLLREYERAKEGKTTPDCRHACQRCGIEEVYRCGER